MRTDLTFPGAAPLARSLHRLARPGLALLLCLLGGAALAQAGNPLAGFPSRTVRLLTPFPPGGPAT